MLPNDAVGLFAFRKLEERPITMPVRTMPYDARERTARDLEGP